MLWCGYDSAKGKHFYTLKEGFPSSLGLSVMHLNYATFFKVTADELEYFVKISDWWRALNEARESSIIDNSQGAGDIHIITQRH